MVDRYDDEIGTYLVKLSGKPLSEKDNHTLAVLLHGISDLERMADHSVNLAEVATEMHKREEKFSKKAEAELDVFTDALREILNTSLDVFATENLEEAERVEPLEEVIDDLKLEVKKRHVKRLSKGKCSAQLGFALSDLITNYERISDHCSNLAVALIQIQDDGFETHEYLGHLKKDNPRFQQLYKEYAEKYLLP